MFKVELGKKVGVLRTNNAAKGLSGMGLCFEAIVLKVGKKYFELQPADDHYEHMGRFSLETGKEADGKYSPDYEAFESFELLRNHMATKSKFDDIKRTFSPSANIKDFSEEKIEKIYDILFKADPDAKDTPCVSGEHRVQVIGKGFKKAKDLEAGDILSNGHKIINVCGKD